MTLSRSKVEPSGAKAIGRCLGVARRFSLWGDRLEKMQSGAKHQGRH